MRRLGVCILGPLTLATADGARPLSGRRRQMVLCVLAAARGAAVSADTLVNALWDDDPPGRPRHALEGQLYRLRRSLKAAGTDDAMVVGDPHGYRLDLDRVDLDVLRFDQLSGRGRVALHEGRSTEALHDLDSALALCRGRPFGELGDHPVLMPYARELDEAVLAARENHVDAALALDRGAGLVPDLTGLVELHPLRERLWVLLMRALVQAGRSADALAVYARAAQVLREELGTDPGPELAGVHREVLTRTSALAMPVESQDGRSDTSSPGDAGRVVTFPSLHGRAREVEELAGAVAAVRDRGSLFVIEGELGIGKTRLLQEVAVRAEAQGATVLWGQCRENGGAPPFWPWVQILRLLAESLPDEVLARCVGAGGPYLARAMPNVVAHLPGVAPAPDSERAQFALFDAVATLLRRAAEERPLVVVLDDLHAADPGSVELLEFLAPEVARAGVVVVVALREIPTGSADLANSFAEIVRHALRLVLSGLDRSAVEAMVADLTAGSASAEMSAKVHQLTEGHPLFVRELVRLLADDEAGTPLPLRSVPEGIRQTMHARLAPLSASVRGLLEVAAVLGRDFELAVLAEVADVTPQRTLAMLADAVAAGIVEEGESGRYTFTHALFREVLYRELAPDRRARLHQQAGESIERLFAPGPGARLADIAHHLLHAAPAGDALRAADYAIRAGDWAAAHLAYGDAVRHFQGALRADAMLPADPARRCRLLIRLGGARFRSGHGHEARSTFDEALNLAREVGDGRLLAQAALAYAQPWDLPGMVVDESRVQALQDALDALDADEHRLRPQVLARLAVELYFADPIDQADDLSQQAVAEAREDADQETLARALIARHFLLWRPLGPTNLQERLRLAQKIQLLTREIGDPELRLRGRIWYLQNLLEAGDLTAFDRELEAFARAAAELRQPVYLSLVPMWRATRSLMRGDLDRAEQHAQEALEIGKGVHVRMEIQPLVVQTFGIQQFCLHRERGRLADVEPVVTATVEALPNVTSWRAALALTYLETGRSDDARRVFEELTVDGFPLRADKNWFNAAALLSGICSDLGDAQRAAQMYERIRPYSRSHAIIGWASGYLGSFSHYLGQLATTMGRYDDAIAHFDDALRAHRRMGAAPWTARTQYHYADSLLRRSRPADRDRAAEMLAAATATTDSLGMEELNGRARALAARQ
jgi:DNA-binding SARP family transcriptional activator/tetratricopeptide (TPR) repeat protein